MKGLVRSVSSTRSWICSTVGCLPARVIWASPTARRINWTAISSSNSPVAWPALASAAWILEASNGTRRPSRFCIVLNGIPANSSRPRLPFEVSVCIGSLLRANNALLRLPCQDIDTEWTPSAWLANGTLQYIVGGHQKSIPNMVFGGIKINWPNRRSVVISIMEGPQGLQDLYFHT